MIPTWYIQIQTLNIDNIAIITRCSTSDLSDLSDSVIGPRLGQAQGLCFFWKGLSRLLKTLETVLQQLQLSA